MANQSKEQNIEDLIQVFEVALLSKYESYGRIWLEVFKESKYVTDNRLYIEFPNSSDNIEFIRTLSVAEIEVIINALTEDVKHWR